MLSRRLDIMVNYAEGALPERARTRVGVSISIVGVLLVTVSVIRR